MKRKFNDVKHNLLIIPMVIFTVVYFTSYAVGIYCLISKDWVATFIGALVLVIVMFVLGKVFYDSKRQNSIFGIAGIIFTSVISIIGIMHLIEVFT